MSFPSSPEQSRHGLERIRVVLSRTSHPGNIGSAARAMKTMGLSRLVLVDPRVAQPSLDPEARALATGGIDVLERAQLCSTLEQALEGAVLAVAFSARPRDLSHEALDVRSIAREAVEAVGGSAGGSDVALVFGNESAGLSNHDVLLCNRLAHIPCDPKNGSLNLAAAVQVAAYEIRMAALGAPQERVTGGRRAYEPATLDEVEQLYAHFESSLRVTGFLDPGKPKRLMERLRRLFGRADLEREEVNILRGMLSAWDDALKKVGQRPPDEQPPKA